MTYTWLSSIRRRQVIGEGFFLSSHVRRIRARYQDRKINVSGNSSAELIHKFDSNRTHWFERIAPFLTFAPHDGSYLPYRRPFFDFTTGSGCNSTSLRTDSRRLAALATRCDLSAGRDRPRSSGFSLGREGRGGGRGVEGERFHGRVKVARRNRWCKRRIGILGEFELVLRDKFGEISTVRPSHDFHDSWNSSRVTRSFPILFGCIREPLLSITRSDAYRRKFRNFETNNGSRCRGGGIKKRNR